MKHSVKTKLMQWIIPTVTISLLLSVYITTKIVSDNDRELAVRSAKETAAKYANELNSQLAASLSAVAGMAHNLEIYNSGNRSEVSGMVKNFVEKNPEFLSSSLCYEPNAFDGADQKYVNQPAHDATGRMIPYWIRGASGVVYDKLTGYEDASSDWYTVPKQTGSPYVTQPLLYNGSLIVSFCVPIMKNGRFAGAAYGDMPLNYLDGVISQIKLFESGYAILLSKQGVFLAAKDKKLIGVKSVKDLTDGGKDEMMKKLAENIQSNDDKPITWSDKETGKDFLALTARIKTTGWVMVVVVPEDEMLAGAYTVRTWLLAIGVVILLLIAGLIYIITARLTKPIGDALALLTQLSKGHLGYRVETTSQDEIGDMIRELDSFSEKLQSDFVGVVRQIARGELDKKLVPIDEHDEITPALIMTIESLNGVVTEARDLIDAAVNGRLEYRAQSEKFSGVYYDIVAGMNSMLNAIVAPVQEGSEVLAVLATGDLTARMSENYKGGYLKISNSINGLAQSFGSALSEVAGAVAATASAATEISSSTEEMAAGAQESSAQTVEIAGAVEEMSKTIFESTQSAVQAADNSKIASDKAVNGAAKVEETKKGMEKIVEATRITGTIISSLSRKTDQIGEITQVIDEIADQTNLLALNAAIEAARAGEQGRGFAVVADEVRKLAERTTKATKEIANTIKTVQDEAKDADRSMSVADQSVQKGMELTQQVADVLIEILHANQNVSGLVSQLAASSEEQSAAAEEISKNLEAISSVTNQSAAGTSQIARAADDLSRLTEKLQTLIAHFTLDESGGGYNAPKSLAPGKKKQNRF